MIMKALLQHKRGMERKKMTFIFANLTLLTKESRVINFKRKEIFNRAHKHVVNFTCIQKNAPFSQRNLLKELVLYHPLNGVSRTNQWLMMMKMQWRI